MFGAPKGKLIAFKLESITLDPDPNLDQDSGYGSKLNKFNVLGPTIQVETLEAFHSSQIHEYGIVKN